METTFTAVFEQHGTWKIGHVEALPGANTQAATLEEAHDSLKEAVQLVVEANRELARRLQRQLQKDARHVLREDLRVTV